MGEGQKGSDDEIKEVDYKNLNLIPEYLSSIYNVLGREMEITTGYQQNRVESVFHHCKESMGTDVKMVRVYRRWTKRKRRIKDKAQRLWLTRALRKIEERNKWMVTQINHKSNYETVFKMYEEQEKNC